MFFHIRRNIFIRCRNRDSIFFLRNRKKNHSQEYSTNQIIVWLKQEKNVNWKAKKLKKYHCYLPNSVFLYLVYHKTVKMPSLPAFVFHSPRRVQSLTKMLLSSGWKSSEAAWFLWLFKTYSSIHTQVPDRCNPSYPCCWDLNSNSSEK